MVELTPEQKREMKRRAIANRAANDAHFEQMIAAGQRALDTPEHERTNQRRRRQ